MKKKYIIWAIIVVILLIAVFTNPNQDAHRDAVKIKMQTLIQREISNTDTDTGEAVASLISGGIVGAVVKNVITSDNYVFFSLTKLNLADKKQIIGIGLFGNVFITNYMDNIYKKSLIK